MTLTIANIPQELDEALRGKAMAEGKALDEVALDAMRTGLGILDGKTRKRDLSGIAGTWISDPEVDAALKDQDRIDPGMWK